MADIRKVGALLVLPVMLVVLLLGGCSLDSDKDTWTTSGYVADTEGNPARGIRIDFKLDPEVSGCVITFRDEGTVLTDRRGYYQIRCDSPREVLEILPSAKSCVFWPSNRYCYASEVYQANQDFVIHCGETYEMSGYVRDGYGNPLQDVTITKATVRPPYSNHTVTSETGYYRFRTVIPRLDYVLTPEAAGCSFEPSSRTYEDFSESQLDQDFTAVCP